MKFAWFLILILIIGFGFYWKHEPHASHAGPPASSGVETAAKVPTSVGTFPTPPPSVQTPSATAQDINIQPGLDKIAALAHYALPTQETRNALIQSLSDGQLQKNLIHVLEANDRLDYDVAQEKLRMNAVSVLGLILKYKDVSHREDVVRWVKQRILAVDFDKMKDIRVKQSVYGDITELLMILKQHDAESFEEVAQRISETNKKVLKTALATSR